MSGTREGVDDVLKEVWCQNSLPEGAGRMGYDVGRGDGECGPVVRGRVIRRQERRFHELWTIV